MTTDESTDAGDGSDLDDETGGSARDRLEAGADRAVHGFDQGLIDLLSWLLDTETRARIFVFLRQSPRATSDEIAEGTGLYPSTVRESLADLHEEGVVERVKRENEGAGNNPYEYTAIAPSELVRGIVSQVQDELNAVCNLDRRLAGDTEDADEPIRIEVRDADEDDEEGEDA